MFSYPVVCLLLTQWVTDEVIFNLSLLRFGILAELLLFGVRGLMLQLAGKYPWNASLKRHIYYFFLQNAPVLVLFLRVGRYYILTLWFFCCFFFFCPHPTAYECWCGLVTECSHVSQRVLDSAVGYLGLSPAYSWLKLDLITIIYF